MKFYLTILLLSFIYCLQLKSAEAELPIKYYNENKNTLIKSRFAVKENFVYVVGVFKKIGSDETALELAESDSFSNLIYLKKHDFIKSMPISDSHFKYFSNWITFYSVRYTAKNRIELDSFIKGKYAYYVAAYKLSDVEFEDKTPITWERIYNDFKKNPDKRDELLFYEIIPENELPALKDVVENNIAKQYGKNFALMFMGNDVPPIPKKRYDIAKKASEKYNSQTSLKILIIAANTLPYDKNICTLLAEKFDEMQMPRCAAIMKERAEENKKLVIMPESTVSAPSEKPAIVPDAKKVADTKETKTTPEIKKINQNPQTVKSSQTESDAKSENEKKAAPAQPVPNVNFIELL